MRELILRWRYAKPALKMRYSSLAMPPPPYHRPPLSKAILTGEKKQSTLGLIEPDVYEQANIKLLSKLRVTAINRADKTIELDNGESLAYGKLALATGSRVRKLALPGHSLNHVYYLRTLEDCLTIKSRLASSKNAVILGGGYIGLETAASLCKYGLSVTVVESTQRVLQRVAAPEISSYFTSLHESKGVRIITGVSSKALHGNDSVESVELTDGQRLSADIVIIGIGVIPNTELAENAGLKIDNGIVVDKFARTEDSNIVATGDCTSHPNKLLDCRVRLESEPNTLEQAKSAAASICGHRLVYEELPWFWSKQYNTKLQIAGLNIGYNRTLIRGNIEQSSFVCWYFKDNQLITADCVNRPKDFVAAKQIIALQVPVTDEQLTDESTELKTLLPYQ